MREQLVVGAFSYGGDVAFHGGDEVELAQFLGYFLADVEDGLVGVGTAIGLGDVVFVEYPLGDAVACGLTV